MTSGGYGFFPGQVENDPSSAGLPPGGGWPAPGTKTAGYGSVLQRNVLIVMNNQGDMPPARVAELVDAPALGAGALAWGFDSPLSHQPSKIQVNAGSAEGCTVSRMPVDNSSQYSRR